MAEMRAGTVGVAGPLFHQHAPSPNHVGAAGCGRGQHVEMCAYGVCLEKPHAAPLIVFFLLGVSVVMGRYGVSLDPRRKC